MSAPEFDPFDALMVGDWALGKTLPMNGIEMIVDADLGDEMRQAFLGVSSQVMAKFGLGDDTLSERQQEQVDKVLYKHMRKGKFPAKTKELIAVSGVGAYLTYAWGEGDDDAASDTSTPGFSIDILTPDQTLFGYFEEVNYNSYPVVDGLEDIPEDYEEVIPVDDAEGLVLALGSVMLCDTEGYGQQHGWYEYAVVPLEVPGLVIQKAFPR